jgi:hippurate hydrolase
MLACGVLLAILLPRAARSKTVDIDMSVPPVVASSASKADAVIATDANVLQRLFRGLHDGSQAGRIEARVAGTIATELLARGFDVAFGADGTEVVATSSNGPGPVLMYRVDTGSDLLVPPRQVGPSAAGSEATLPSHRCGHDVAITWMLGMARALAVLRDDWSGTLVVVSQPTRMLGSMPSLKTPGAEQRRIPKPDMVLAMSAAPSPLGSILSVRGQRRAGSDTAEVVMSRIGAYEAPRHAERVASLAASTTRLYGLPEDALFGYLLVGTARHALDDIEAAEIETPELDAAGVGAASSEPGFVASAVDLAAIPLGTKLATVAVLELLDKSNRARGKSAPAAGRGWTLHHY